MIRKSLFLGLTLVLIVALIALIVRGYKMEKEQVHKPSEAVEEAKPTPTRVLAPQDLEIVEMKTVLEKEGDEKGPSRIARHDIEIRNNGKVAYGDIQLRFVYFSLGHKTLRTKIYSANQIIPPEKILKLDNIRISDIPIAAVTSKASIICADIAPTPAAKQ